MKKNVVIYAVITVIVVFGLYFLSSGNSASGELAEAVACVDSEQPLRQHIHSNLKIFVDGKEEIITPNIGLDNTCHRALHTHDADGEIHVEANDRLVYTLGLFYNVWGETIEREGKELSVSVDGLPFNANPYEISLEDGKEIVLIYSSQDGKMF